MKKYLGYKRKNITKDTLKNRLKQMVRSGILAQEKSRDPYFLREKWYNAPIKILMGNIIDFINSKLITDVDNIGSEDEPSMHNIDVLLGLDYDNIPDTYKVEIEDKILDIKGISASLFLLKCKIIEEEGKKILTNFYKSLNEGGKKIWMLRVDKDPDFYKKLIRLSTSLVIIGEGKIPSEKCTERFCCNEPEPIRSLVIKAVKSLNKKNILFYPFGAGVFSYYDREFFDMTKLSDRQKKQLLLADVKSAFDK
jgi:hypothetical protein